MADDPFAELRRRVLRRALEEGGESDPALRRDAAAGTGLPDDLAPLVRKIHDHAYRVTDDDIASLRAVYGDDRLFEIVVSASLGAAEARLTAALRALEEA